MYPKPYVPRGPDRARLIALAIVGECSIPRAYKGLAGPNVTERIAVAARQLGLPEPPKKATNAPERPTACLRQAAGTLNTQNVSSEGQHTAGARLPQAM